MKPVDQQHFYQEEPRKYGDCYRACVASILELPLTEVPHFLEQADGKVYKFYTLVEDFLALRGYEPIYHQRPHEGKFYIASGVSPRNPQIHHAVVYQNGIVHDPHPDRTGLMGSNSEWTFTEITKVSHSLGA